MIGLKTQRLYYSYVQGLDFEKSRKGYNGWQIEQWLDDGRKEA